MALRVITEEQKYAKMAQKDAGFYLQQAGDQLLYSLLDRFFQRRYRRGFAFLAYF